MSVQAANADRIEGGSTRTTSFPWSLSGVLSAGLLYGLLHAGLRIALSANLPQDDVTANILAQTLEPGYLPKQPPLYEWLLWSVQRLTGPTLPSFLLIKYGLLTVTFGFLYLVATRVFADRKWAVLAALSPLLIYEIGWNLHEGVTHTMVLICAVAASFWAFVRMVERGAAKDYVVFGACLGAGLISKWGFAAFCVALAASALLQPVSRARLLSWRMLLSAAVAVIVAAPVIYWLLAGGHDLVSVYDRSVAPMASDRLRATLTGLGLALFAPLAFLFPLDLILVVLFPRMVQEAARSVKSAFSRHVGKDSASVSWEMLILHMTLAGFLILLLGALLTGATHYLERYMHPMFLLTPIWLLAMVERTRNPSRKATILAVVLVTVTAAVLPVRAYDLLHAMGSHCKKCRVAIPYDGLATALKERGFHSGTIIAESRHDAGNLRRFFPQARISCLESPSYVPPLRGERGDQVALVLKPKSRVKYLREARRQVAALGGHFETHPEEVTIPWQPFPRSSAPRTWQWSVLVLDLAAPE